MDTQYESCDPADPNKTGWGPGGCDASCKPITTQTPQCSSTITGTLSAPISATTPGLCAVGTVSGFTATPGANGTINYQWNCNIGGVVVSPAPTPVSCTANYRPQADLTIKKYIGTNDAQPNAPVTQSTNATFDYVLRVQNVSSLTATGLTTVKDVLPAGVTQNGTPSGANWTCSYAGNTLTCTTTQEIAAGAYFSNITVPVKVTAGANSTVRNDATVHNPNELNTCYTDNRMPTGAEQSCEKDPNNTDPAVFTIGGGGGGGYTFYVPKCISPTQNTCSTIVYTTKADCIAANGGVDRCYQELATCQANINNVDRSPAYCNPGPGGGGGGTGGGYSPYCGDGILQPGEECDAGPNGSAWCGAPNTANACKIKGISTTPGDNPITDIWMTIPALSNARLGYTWLDGETGKIRFQDNRMVIGKNTKVFTLADTVGFGLKTEYQGRIPLQLESNKRFCINSS